VSHVRLILLSILGIISLLNSQRVFAALELELTQGVTNKIPIAILVSKPASIEEDNLSRIIKKDLTHSGQFKVSFFPGSTLQSSASYWRGRNIEDIAIAHLRRLDRDQFRVTLQLMNVVQNKNHILAQQEFTIEAKQLRGVAHHLSDIIYEKLTGIKGVFSTRIAYVLVTNKNNPNRSYSLQVADMDGDNAKSLVTSSQPIMSPAWSHDGKRIAYVSFEKVLPRIYIQTVSTGERELISSYPGINGAPAWSPDDQTLALALSKDSATPKIYLMNLLDRKLRQITFGQSIDTEPSFSYDGKTLLFTSDRGGGPQIYQISVRSGKIQRITFDGNYNARASFSADGKMMVVLNQEQGSYNIAVQDLAEDKTFQILTHSGYDASPSFAPNGQMVLFETKPETQSLLGMVSVDGRISLRLPTPQGDVQDPTWSPFLS
jgi:TolB protein